MLELNPEDYTPPDIRLAASQRDIAAVRSLWCEYWKSLGFPMRFQGFAAELKRLPGEYAPPRGLILLAFLGQTPAGAIALRPLSEATCEAKRLYVRPQDRRRKLGRLLLHHAIQSASAMGYSALYGDTLPSMKEARALYASLGFQEVGAYADPPTPGATYLRLPLIVRENH